MGGRWHQPAGECTIFNGKWNERLDGRAVASSSRRIHNFHGKGNENHDLETVLCVCVCACMCVCVYVCVRVCVCMHAHACERITSAAKRVGFVSDRMSYIIRGPSVISLF
jgi:hypothetical protein